MVPFAYEKFGLQWYFCGDNIELCVAQTPAFSLFFAFVFMHVQLQASNSNSLVLFCRIVVSIVVVFCRFVVDSRELQQGCCFEKILPVAAHAVVHFSLLLFLCSVPTACGLHAE